MKKLLTCLFTAAWLATSLSLSLLAPVGFANAAAAQTEAQADAKKLADVEAAIKDLNRQLNDIKVQRSELEKQLAKSEKNISDTMKHVDELKSQIKAKEKQAGALSSGKKN